ncbi:MAG: Ig-like domain-containing protein [Ruminococcus sp.]|nr:Ig-like domain-containing protein [Ruminococcus sp.]
MKHLKFLSIVLAVMIAFSSLTVVFAVSNENDVTTAEDIKAQEQAKIEEILHSGGYYPEFCVKLGKIDDIYVYKAGSTMFTELYYSKILGNYLFTSHSQQPGYDFGIYIIKDDCAYTLENALKQDVVDDDCMDEIMQFIGLSGPGWNALKLTEERKAFLEMLGEKSYGGEYSVDEIENFKEIGSLDSNSGKIKVYSNYYKGASYYSTFSDWLITQPYYNTNKEYGIFIVYSEDSKISVCRLEDAVKSGLIDDEDVLNAVAFTNGDITARKLKGNEKAYVDYLIETDKFTTRVYEYKELGAVDDYTLVLGRTDNDPRNTGLPTKTVEYAGIYKIENSESFGEQLYLIKDSEVLTIPDAYDKGVWIGDIKDAYLASGDTHFTITRTGGNDTNEKTEKLLQVLKSYIKSKSNSEGRYLSASFGEYKGFLVCYAGYELTQPWEPWARIGNYAFKLNTQLESDEQMLGLYLVKDSEVLRLEDAYNNSTINDKELSNIIKLILSKDTYKNYFYIYDITDLKVGTIGDYEIRYEGITNSYFEFAENVVEVGKRNIKLGKYDLYVCGYSNFTPNGNTRGLYVLDKENNKVDLVKAYESSLIGTSDEVINLLRNSELSGKGYWEISKVVGSENTTPTEPVYIPHEPKIFVEKSKLKAGETCHAAVMCAKAKSWKSSNKKVATVKNGKVTALKKGTTTITATLIGGKKLSRKITVKNNPTIKIGKKKLNKSKTYEISKGKSLVVKIKGTASAVKNKYKTSKKSVAKVTSKAGAKTVKIKGCKKGSAKITLNVNGVEFKIKVKVK